MPELPEVETVVRDLRAHVLGDRIIGVWTDWPKSIKNPAAQSRHTTDEAAVRRFKKDLVGRTIEGVVRRGKNILIQLSGDYTLLVHQKMTGHFLLGSWRITPRGAIGVAPAAIINDSYNRYVHLIFTLASGRQLGLSDVRKFAKALCAPRAVIEALPEITGLGPDAFTGVRSATALWARLEKQQRPIKQVLMDPAVIAGIGNIYADDILWRAAVHPRRRATTLTLPEVEKIYTAMRAVLTKAVRLRGTSTSDFRDIAGREGGYTGHRLVYQRTNEPCGRCKTAIERMVIAGRSAHYCPHCQPPGTGTANKKRGRR
jgi:formamidopyrimidine-DNA glycosylase